MSGRTPDEGRYSKVTRRMWNDEKFCRLSGPKPNAQTLWKRLLTGPELGCIPGLFSATLGGLADALGWPRSATEKCWKEIASLEMAEADWRAGVVWVPNAIVHNEPASTNTVIGWRTALRELPECDLKRRATDALRGHLEGMGEAWGDAFAVAMGEAIASGRAKPSPKPKAMARETDRPIHVASKTQDSGAGDPETHNAGASGVQVARPPDHFAASFVTRSDELPETFKPNAEHAALAKRLGLVLAEEFGLYRARRQRDRYICANWDADFEGWLLQGAKLARERAEKRGRGTKTHGGPSDEWPTDADISLREQIRGGSHGSVLKAKLEAGQLDAQLARTLIRNERQEREDRRRDREENSGPRVAGEALASILRRAGGDA